MSGLDNFSNVSSVSADNTSTAADKTTTPPNNGFLSELQDDMMSGRGEAVTALSAVAGFGMRAVLARSPVATAAVAALGSLAIAGTELARGGKDLPTITEGAIGLGMGAFGASAAVSHSPAMENFSFAATRRVEYATRALMPQDLWFKLPGSKALGEDIVSASQTVDINKLVEQFSEPWTGVERARTFDITGRRATLALPGTPDTTYMGFRAGENQIALHSHPPGHAGDPSLFDFVSNDSLNVIDNGDTTTIFRGQHAKWLQAQDQAKGLRTEGAKSAQTDSESLTSTEMERYEAFQVLDLDAHTMTYDKVARTARVDSANWSGEHRRWENQTSTTVDYQAAISALSEVDPKDYSMQFLKNLAEKHSK